jgi:hypothetical protein
VALLVLPALSGGRLGMTELVGPRVHRVLDYALVPVLATSPWWSGMGWGAGGVWVVEALAIVVLWLARATTYRRVTPAPEPPSGASRTTNDAARAAGRLAGAIGRKGPRAAGVAVGRIKRRRR